MAEENEEKEGKVLLEGSPIRVMAGKDPSGNKRILRCDEEGYLLCKVVPISQEVIED